MSNPLRNRFLALLAGLALGTAAQGQESPAPASPVSPAPTPAETQPDCKRLDRAGLEVLLKEIGYEPQGLEGDWLKVVYNHPKWKNVTIRVGVGDSGRNIWFNAPVTRGIKNAADVPAQVYLNLLADNYRLGPTHFGYDVNSKSIAIVRAFANCNVTKDSLRQEFENFADFGRITWASWTNPSIY